MIQHSRTIFLLSMVVLLWLGGCASTGLRGSPELPGSLDRLAAGPIRPPRGYLDWCASSPDDCAGDRAMIADSFENRAALALALASVRGRVAAKAEPPGSDVWRLPANGAGDCEDFALQLRRDLVRAGLPRGALKIAVAREPAGGRLHAVLAVLTDGPTLVLDPIRQAEPQDWRETDLAFLALEDSMPNRTWRQVGMPSHAP